MVDLSPPQRLLGVGEVDRGNKQGSLGPSVPRALSLTLSPASKLPTRPKAKEAYTEERDGGP